MTVSLANIQAVLRAEDVEGLLALGAPSDEYSHEATAIESALSSLSHPTEADILEIIRQVWNKYFGPLSDEDIKKRLPAFQQVALRLLS